MSDENKQQGMRGMVRKAVQAGAAYGVLAGGAYGACHLVSNQTANSQEPARQEQPQGRIVWSSNNKYAPQTRFLKIVHAAWDGGNARVRMIRKAVDETYSAGKADLAAMFSGVMDEKPTSVEIAESGALVVTLSYSPSKESPESRFGSVRVKCHVGAKEPADREKLAAEFEGRTAIGAPDVRLLSREGLDPASGKWVSLEVPADSQPTMQAAPDDSDDEGDCAYPRWNPRGIRYGFISRDGLSHWYA